MAKAQKLPSGAWRTQVSKKINGKLVRKSFTVSPSDYNADPKSASRLAKSESELLARSWLFEKEEERREPLTVEKAIDRYNETRKGVVSPSTYADYLRMKKHFDSILNEDIHDVTTDMLQGLISAMALKQNRYGRNLDERTIKNRIFYLLAVLKYFEIDKRFKLIFPAPRSDGELSPPEKNEFERLLECAETDEDRLILMLGGLYTLRRGEICGLRGESVLWDLHSIRVSHSRVLDENKQWVIKPPKTPKSVRTIEIAPEYMCLFPRVEPQELLIKKNPNECTKMFIKLRKKACVNCRLHDLRKYAASIRSDMMPMKYVEADGGWKPGSSVVRSVYDRPFKESRKRHSKEFNEKAVRDYADKLLG